MIFITLGSQKFQFNRLLIEVDRLIESGAIEEEIFAQIGYSDYRPKNYKFKQFLDRDEFSNCMERAHTIITHGGTGAIITALKNKKYTIAIPRLQKYGEHVDDHQKEIVSQFIDMNLIIGIDEVKQLKEKLNNRVLLKTYISNTKSVLDEIESYLKKCK